MMVVHPCAEGRAVVGEALEPDAEFTGLLKAPLPMKIGSDGSVYLSTGGEAHFNGAAGEAIGVDALRSGGPSDEHAGSFVRKVATAKPKHGVTAAQISP